MIEDPGNPSDIAPIAPTDEGGIGGLLLDRIGRRAVLRTLQCAVQRGLHVGDIGLGKAIAVAEAILDDDTATARDKLRASEFIKAVTDKGIEVALAAEKGDGPASALGSGKMTLVVNIMGVNDPEPPPIVQIVATQ